MNRSASWKHQGSKSLAKAQLKRRAASRRPSLESLEDRQLLATLNWVGDVDGSWATNILGDTNWSGDAIPAVGDTLVFPEIANNKAMTNNLGVGNAYTLSFTGGNYTLSGDSISLATGSGLTDTSSTGSNNSINADLVVTGASSINGPNWPRRVVLAGGIQRVAFSPILTMSGEVQLSGNSNFDGTTDLVDDELILSGGVSYSSSILINGGSLQGTGTVRSIRPGTNGGVSPGFLGTGRISTDYLELNQSNFADIVAFGSTPSVSYDQIDVTGQVLLGNSQLFFSLGYVPPAGTQFTIINNDGTDPIQGTFANLPNGSMITSGAVGLSIRYDGGDGNDVVVTALGDPSATPDVYALPENSVFSVTLASQGVLANDTDPNGLPLQAFLVQGPTNGTLQLNGDGTFTYTPALNYFGPDSFLYTATDAYRSSQPTLVRLNVNEVFEAPIATGDSYKLKQDSTLTVSAPGVLTNDVARESYNLAATVYVNPVHAQSFVFNELTGAFTYTPVAGFSGTDSFTYRARYQPIITTTSGAVESNEVTVLLTIDPIYLPPTAVDDTFTATADQTFSVVGPGVLANDVNPNPTGAMTAFLVTATTNGTVTLAPDGSFNYTPNANFSGTDTFQYRAVVGDALSATPATVTITVRPVNHAPIARDDVATVVKDSSVAINVLANDSDVDPSTVLSAIIVTQPLNGVVTAGPGSQLTYTPNAGYTGNDSFTYRASDGTLTSELATVNITITQTNLPPTPVNDSFSVNENSVLTVAAPGVLGNDTDPQGYALSAFLQDAPANGVVTLSNNGSFVYTPKANFSGVDTFTYLISNGSLMGTAPATVTITVNHVASRPTANPDSYTLTENTTLVLSAPGVLLNDVNPNPGSPTLTIVNLPTRGSVSLNNNGSLSYTPFTDFFGVDSFTYYITSESLTSTPTTVTLNVQGTPTAPGAVDDAYTTRQNTPLIVSTSGVLANDVNPDLNTLRAILVSGPANGQVVLNSDGSFTYTPIAKFFGTDTFTYRAANPDLWSLPATVTITVPEVPVAPIANDDSFSVFENATLSISPPGLMFNDVSTNSGTPTITVYNAPSRGSLVVQNNGSFIYTPATNYFGPDSFTYFLTSLGLNSGLATVNINVLPVATTPTAVADNYTTAENTPITVGLDGVLANDLNPDRNTLNAVLVSGPLNGQVVLAADGSFTYTPKKNFYGTDIFTYRARNPDLFSAPATVTITVPEVPVAPIANNDSFSVFENAVLTITPPGLMLNDQNENSGTPTITVYNSPSHGSLTTQNDGSFVYTPATNYFGPDSFTYFLTSLGLRSELATVNINVLPVATTPTAVADFYGTNQNVPFTASVNGVLANDLNPDKDTLNAVLVTGPGKGSVALNSNGSFTYTPYLNFFGTDTFTYRAVNTSLFSAPATVTITVQHVNQPPVAVADAYTIERDQNLVVAAPGVLTNDSDPDPGDTLQAVLVNTTQNGALTLNPDGSFVYRPLPGFTGMDWFSYSASDGTLLSPPVTVTITVRDVPYTTVQLDPLTDTGASSTDRITKWTTPTFFGKTGYGQTVKLSVRPLGSNVTPTVVGTAVADGAGNYNVTSSPLADGQYEFFVESFRPDGRGTGAIWAGPLTIDTVSPVLIDVQLTPKLGQMYLAYTDVGAGIDGGSTGRPSNYSMARYGSGSSPAYSPTNFNVLTSFLNPNTFNVVIQFSKGKPLPKGWYIFAALSGGKTGIQDVAGNALAGYYTGTLPTGNGMSGGDFRAYFNVGKASISLPRYAGGFVPILPPVIKNSKSVPTYSTPSTAKVASSTSNKPQVTVKVTKSEALPKAPKAKATKKG